MLVASRHCVFGRVLYPSIKLFNAWSPVPFLVLTKAILVFNSFSSLGMSNVMPFLAMTSLILTTKSVGIFKSLIWVNRSRFRFRFSTSATTTATSGKSLSFLLSNNSMTTFSSIEDALRLYVPGKSKMCALTPRDNLQTPSFLSTVMPG